jgi:hypothetical protein
MGIQGHPDIFISNKDSSTNESNSIGISVTKTIAEQQYDSSSIDQNELSKRTISKQPVIIELKYTVTGDRLGFESSQFKNYLSQLLFYMSSRTWREAFCRYATTSKNWTELNWIKRDDRGDHYLRPYGAKNIGIESWPVTLQLDDIARDLIRDQIIQRKDRFLKSLTNNAVEVLPRLQGKARPWNVKVVLSRPSVTMKI